MIVAWVSVVGWLGGAHTRHVGGVSYRPPRCALTATASPAEAAAVKEVLAVASSLTRFGLDGGDKREWDRLNTAVASLSDAMPSDPPIALDQNLVGDWQLVGCSSPNLVERKGLTGLGDAPFTNLAALHVSFTAAGKVTARETLTFFGKPVILNELRGSAGFSDEGDAMQETYTEADVGGQQSSPAFSPVECTLLQSGISSCGSVRLGRDVRKVRTYDTGVYVFRKMREGELDDYLKTADLPTSGGTYLGNPTWRGPKL